MIDLFAGLGPEREGWMVLGVGEIERFRLACHQADQAFVLAQHGQVHGVGLQTFGGVKLERSVDAQHHPAFSFRPETGEEIYHSFLGVPILRAGNTLGVLVVQNRAARSYSDDEEEALQTTAMVLAETIASGELSALAKPGLEPAAHRPVQLEGLSISDGIGLGYVVLHEPRVIVTKLIADDPQKELQRIDTALNTLRADLDVMLERRDVADAGEHREVL